MCCGKANEMSCAAADVVPATAQAAAVAAPAGAALEAAAAGARPLHRSCSSLLPVDYACGQHLCMLRCRCGIAVALAAQLPGWPATPAPTCRHHVAACTFFGATRSSYGRSAVITIGSWGTYLLQRNRPEQRMRQLWQRRASTAWLRLCACATAWGSPPSTPTCSASRGCGQHGKRICIATTVETMDTVLSLLLQCRTFCSSC